MADSPEETTTNENAEAIAGLREIADFLEAHPDFPKVSAPTIYVWAHSYQVKNSRVVMSRIAERLGDRATETVLNGDVIIEGAFGPAKLQGRCYAKDLGAEPQPPSLDYDPILPVCAFCHGKPVGDAATWLDDIERPAAPCPRCGKTNTGPAV